MAITRQFLSEHIARMQSQVTAYNGAIEFAQFLLTTLDDEGMPIEEFAEMVAGAGASATIEPVEKNHG